MFAFLKRNNKPKLVFDPESADVDDRFHKMDWRGFYPEAGEDKPPKTTEPLGSSMNVFGQ